jgi:hypothetical protein
VVSTKAFFTYFYFLKNASHVNRGIRSSLYASTSCISTAKYLAPTGDDVPPAFCRGTARLASGAATLSYDDVSRSMAKPKDKRLYVELNYTCDPPVNDEAAVTKQTFVN